MNYPTISNPTRQTTLLVQRGTLIAVTFLGILLLIYDGIVRSIWLENRTWIFIIVFAYLLTAELMLRRNHEQTVNYMLIAFYIFLSFFTLVFSGLNTAAGLITLSFAVLLPSLLIGSRSIMPVALLSIFTLLLVQTIHSAKIISPDLNNLSLESTFWDVAAYSTVLSVFALVSWLSGTQRERNLNRALGAETKLRAQKNMLAIELENESSELRLSRLDQIHHLHKFALLGQTTAATLHELSNHLSVLNLDIDDIRQQVNNSKAIENAKESIDHINSMVKQARQQLRSYDQYEYFDAASIINQSIKDVSIKFNNYKIKINKTLPGKRLSSLIYGSPLALTQVITVLLNNAHEACRESINPEVKVLVKSTKNTLVITVIDNGPGIKTEFINSLFSPVASSKPNGLGVGLYIAKHLTEKQLKGTIKHSLTEHCTCFTITLPKNKPKA